MLVEDFDDTAIDNRCLARDWAHARDWAPAQRWTIDIGNDHFTAEDGLDLAQIFLLFRRR
ncbi:hypothetical protein CPI83_28680 [Rhodococcus sp. H-CA8f]|nr:hypothetical protein CPI83_28680 [Rhodococcus sp. H-CA8f]